MSAQREFAKMMGRTHMAIGLLVALLVAPLFTTDQKTLFVGLVVFASLLPDIDHSGSKINRILPLTRYAARFFRHRGVFHSIFPPLAVLGAAYYYDYFLIGQALAVGYISHLLSDGFTKLGVNYLYPISQFRIMGFIEVGTIWEGIIFAGTVVAIATVVFL